MSQIEQYSLLSFLFRPENQTCLYKEVITALGDSFDEEKIRQCLIDLHSVGVVLLEQEKITVQAEKFVFGYVAGLEMGGGRLITQNNATDKSEKNKAEKIHISTRQMQRLIDGDYVLARVGTLSYRGSTKREAKVIQLVAPNQKVSLGRVKKPSGKYVVQPLYGNSSQLLPIADDGKRQLKKGNIVKFQVTKHPFYEEQALVNIVEIVSTGDGPDTDTMIAIHRYELPHAWSEEDQKQVRQIVDSFAVQSASEEKIEQSQRIDLRDLPFVTIDGEDAQDFDDAIYCQKQDKQWLLWVAIADVSHYVKANTTLDKTAEQRGTSVYFPNRVIPMLPEALSNDICSLKPHQDRNVLVCKIALNKDGQKQRYEFFPAVIQSQGRLTYNQVKYACIDREKRQIKQLGDLMTDLDNLYTLSQKLTENRRANGLLEFDFSEPAVVFDQQGGIESITTRPTNAANRIVEECMLLANICAAELIYNKRKNDGIFRNHPQPDADALLLTRKILNAFGLNLGGENAPQLRDYIAVAEKAATRPRLSSLINFSLLKSFSKADYSNQALGHFALGFPLYTHFTSPIRRYPDLVVHRLIKQIVNEQKKEELSIKGVTVEKIAHHCSQNEYRAEQATYYAMARYKARFIMPFIGERFHATVVSIKEFGLFVRLDKFFIEGLVHVTRIGRDYYHFNSDTYQLIGERSGQTFSLGDTLEVTVYDADIDKGTIDFSIARQNNKNRGGRYSAKKQNTKRYKKGGRR